jgi:HEAT repeat protein
MAEPADRAALPPEAAARLVEFARTCKAAARAVSLYPAAHPAIVASLSRIAEATAALTQHRPCTIQVLSQELVTDQGSLPKPDPAVTELASLLHRHLIGRLTLNVGADAAAWRTLLLLLARAPEEVRADGGIAHLWATAGGPSIEITEIDYAEVLRERQSGPAAIENILAAALSGGAALQDEATIESLIETLADPAAARALMEQLERATAAAPQGVELHTGAFLSLVRALVTHASERGPEQLRSIFGQLGRAARHLSVDAMISLLAARAQPQALAGTVDVVGGVVDHMNDESIAGFVADDIVQERGATERLAHAFRALVPEYSRQRQLLALAREEVAQSEIGTGDQGFSDLWNRVEGILTSYSDERYVSTEYARELSHARTQPMDVERTSDDPPERVAAWLGTVSDVALRNLDHDLLTDLLSLESDPLRWRDVADTVAGHADDLVRVDFIEQALALIQKLTDEAAVDPARQPHAAAALERFGRGSLLKHMPAFLRNADPDMYEQVKRLCHTIGPTVIVRLAEGLAAEQDARARRRLRDILVGFGPKGAESVRALMNAGNWEVRRTAAFLLREFGGSAGLRELVPLLSDAEPLVQREAVHGLAMNGSREACTILLNAVLTTKGRARGTLVKEVLALRGDHAAAFFAHALRELEPDRLPELYDTAMEVLGGINSDEAVQALTIALHKGPWWAPFANRKRRGAAAESLRRIGSQASLDALREAAAHGPSGVRTAARAALERTAS